MTAHLKGRRQAAALRYEPDQMQAPEIVATGEGVLAEQIVQLARTHGVPVHQSADLVALLTRLPADTAIPPDLYRAVAEVIVFLLRTAERRTGKP